MIEGIIQVLAIIGAMTLIVASSLCLRDMFDHGDDYEEEEMDPGSEGQVSGDDEGQEVVRTHPDR